ncbi:MAG: hypothetical protein G01um101429_761 [Parcubacteria group bacterium Gr01-1014_29]|nr:MAG: hypothetical protein G01um101429_761 [Parcubacteria group bacterium Gr01-1014_29]
MELETYLKKQKTYRGENLFLFQVSGFKFQVPRNTGQAAITAVLFFVFISLAIVFSITSIAYREIRDARVTIAAHRSYAAADGGVEDAYYRVTKGKQISSTENLTIDGVQVITTITDVGLNKKDIIATGDTNNHIRKAKLTLKEGATAVSFNYGVQVDVGGLDMNSNSQVNGNVFSNGNIEGGTGAVITGDAFVAAGTLSSINQSWTIQNTDVLFGTPQGAVITTIDSAGSVGDYNSIALGSDNLARISYIDGTNDDLKFVRCTNDDCSSAVINVVDSAGSVDEVTSLAMGTDGFGRISYYHDGNDDLKFAQCTNADCSSRVLTTIDSASNVGDFSALVVGSDGFARIAYWYDTASDVRFARCTNADCSGKIITNVETAGNVGEYIDLVLGTDGFGRMSYYNSSNGDLKFARCTDADCSTRVITSVDTSGTVGQYTSLALGSDGFARISYYDSSNGDLKFARCTNADCTAKTTNTVDNASSVGKPSSLVLGPDGFGRMSSYASGLGDLRYVRCTDDACTPPTVSVDIAQSFTPTITNRITHVGVFVRKVGNPSNATIRIVRDVSGSPSTVPTDILATGALIASSIGPSYGWHTAYLTSTPTLTSGTLYWIVIDATPDNANYFYWGADSGAGYASGSAKRTLDWVVGGWVSLSSTDLDFRVYMGGVDHHITDVRVNGNARAHEMTNVQVGGNADGYTYTNNTVTGNAHMNSLSSCTVNGNATYNTISSCTVGGTQTTPTVPPGDLAPQPLPITQAVIDAWKAAAEAGGITAGDVVVSGTQTIGPRKITGKLTVTNGSTLMVSGTLWVVGDIVFDNNSIIRLSSGYGTLSGVVISDSKIDVKNNAAFSGSGNPASFMMLLDAKDSIGEETINVDNNSTGVIYYAGKSWIKFSNNSAAKEATAYGIRLDNNAEITYDSGLANASFSSSPAGGWSVESWVEVE